MSIRMKVLILTVSVMIPLILIVSYFELSNAVDKSVYYLEREMFSRKLDIVNIMESLKEKVDSIFERVSLYLEFGESPESLEIEGPDVVEVIEVGGSIRETDIVEKKVESLSKEGLIYYKFLRTPEKRFLVIVVLSPTTVSEYVKDSKNLIITTQDGYAVFPKKLKGEKLSFLNPRKVGYIFSKLEDLLDKYDIRLVEINGERYYVMPVDQTVFPEHIVYTTLSYKKAVSILKGNLGGMLILSSIVVVSTAILIFLYTQHLTKPIENIIEQLARKRESREYSEINVNGGSKDVEELVVMINDLLSEVSDHMSELEDSYSRLEDMHKKVLDSREKIMKLNTLMNELMLIRDRKSVLDMATYEVRTMFDEIEGVCYEILEDGTSKMRISGGVCVVENGGKEFVVESRSDGATYKFRILSKNGVSDEVRHVLELFFNMVVAIAENRNLWNQIENSYFYLTQKLSEISEVYDDETGQHIKRVGEYCALIARELGMDEDYVEKIRMFSQLHDIGKLRVPRSILTKPEPLTPEEFEVMKKHTIYGAEFIGDQPWLEMAKNIALYHHENWDGTGYPFGLKGEDIPLEARIVKLADVYDALRSPRRYKPPFDHFRTMEIILKGDGRTGPAHFDPKILEVFERVHLRFNEIFEMFRD